MITDDFSELESALEYRFSDPLLLRQALTHSSLAHEIESRAPVETSENGEISPVSARDNEQFEFLGDAVLGLVTSELLFQRYPNYHEGQLSKMRAHLVSAKHLVKVARNLQLGGYLLLGRGEERSGGRAKPALLADALEALIAAIYLDGGMKPAQKAIINLVLEPELQRLDAAPSTDEHFTDYKSALQEWVQAKGYPQPIYSVVTESGPEHRKLFTMEVRIFEQGAQNEGKDPLYVAVGEDSTKKKAEQQAAKIALEHLRSMEPMQAEQP
jgi:ribonuclease III